MLYEDTVTVLAGFLTGASSSSGRCPRIMFRCGVADESANVVDVHAASPWLVLRSWGRPAPGNGASAGSSAGGSSVTGTDECTCCESLACVRTAKSAFARGRLVLHRDEMSICDGWGAKGDGGRDKADWGVPHRPGTPSTRNKSSTSTSVKQRHCPRQHYHQGQRLSLTLSPPPEPASVPLGSSCATAQTLFLRLQLACKEGVLPSTAPRRANPAAFRPARLRRLRL